MTSRGFSDGGTPTSLANLRAWAEKVSHTLKAMARNINFLIQYVDSGTYTPTLTNTANIASSTAYEAQWLRVGDVVTVSGRVDIDPVSTGTQTTLGISLPVESNLSSSDSNDCAGTAQSNAVAGGAVIIGDSANDRATLSTVDVNSTSAAGWWFHFSYRVI